MSRLVDLLLVISPPFLPETPHLGVAHLTEYLESKGINVEVYDFSLEVYHRLPEGERYLWNTESYREWSNMAFVKRFWQRHAAVIHACTEEMLALNPVAIGFSVRLFNCLSTMRAIEQIRARRSNITIITGGTDFYSLERQGRQEVRMYGFSVFDDEKRGNLFKHWLKMIDLIVIGEGEETMLEVMSRLSRGQDLSGIPGTARFRRGQHEVNPLRPLVKDLDSLPFPTYAHFDLKRYTGDTLMMLTSRGCKNQCTFCVERHVWRNRLRSRSPDHVAAEMQYHKKHNKVDFIKAADQALNSSVPRLGKICERLADQQTNIGWGGSVIVNPQMDRPFLRLCKRVGAHTFTFGIESGSPRILQMMRKPFNLDEAEKNLRDCRHEDIHTRINLIIGFPGETEDDFQQSLGFITRNHYNISSINLLRTCLLYHDTDLAKHPEHFNLDREEVRRLPEQFAIPRWKDSAGMDIDVRRTRLSRCTDLVVELGVYLDGQPLPPDWKRRKDVYGDPDQWSWIISLLDAWNAGPYPLDTLLKLGLDHPDQKIRAGSAKLVGLMRLERLYPELREKLSDPVRRVQEMSARALSLIGNPDFYLALKPLLENYDKLEPPFQRDLRTMYAVHRYRNGLGGENNPADVGAGKPDDPPVDPAERPAPSSVVEAQPAPDETVLPE